MPCRSDYMEQNGREKGLQETSQLLQFAYEELNKRRTDLGTQLVPAAALDPAGATYYAADVGQVQALCTLIRGMTDEDRDAIVYDGHNATSRQLANWWEAHQAADADLPDDPMYKEFEAEYEAEAEKIYRTVTEFGDDEALVILGRAWAKVVEGVSKKAA